MTPDRERDGRSIARGESGDCDLDRLTRARGRLVTVLRRRVGLPLRRRIPVDAFRRYHRFRRRVVPRRYTDADPLALVRVDPTRIERSVLETAPDYPQWGRVVGGEWDRRSEPFAERPVYRAVVERFEDGRSWEETALYDHFAAMLCRYGNAWGYTSMADFERRCAEIERLYASIRDRGYLTRAALAGRSADAPFDEINVDVARDGTLCWRAYGQHRLAIARVLEVEAVPVLVHRRHRRWQSIRDAVRDRSPTALGSRLDRLRRTHPDLRDLRSTDRAGEVG